MKKFGLIFLLTPLISFAMSYDDDIADMVEYEGEVVWLDNERFENDGLFFVDADMSDMMECEEHALAFIDEIEAEDLAGASVFYSQEDADFAFNSPSELEQEESFEVQPVQQRRAISQSQQAKRHEKDPRNNSNRPRVTHRGASEKTGKSDPLARKESLKNSRKERNDLVEENLDETQLKDNTARAPLQTRVVQKRKPAHEAVYADEYEEMQDTRVQKPVKQYRSKVVAKPKQRKTLQEVGELEESEQPAPRRRSRTVQQPSQRQGSTEFRQHRAREAQAEQMQKPSQRSMDQRRSQATVQPRQRKQAASQARQYRGQEAQQSPRVAYKQRAESVQQNQNPRQKRVGRANEMRAAPKQNVQQQRMYQNQQRVAPRQQQRKSPTRTTVYEEDYQTMEVRPYQQRVAPRQQQRKSPARTTVYEEDYQEMQPLPRKRASAPSVQGNMQKKSPARESNAQRQVRKQQPRRAVSRGQRTQYEQDNRAELADRSYRTGRY